MTDLSPVVRPSHTRRNPNVRLIGGEMLTWSDAENGPKSLPVLAELLPRAVPAGGRVLVAGPHPLDVFDQLVERCGQVTALLRSFPDAQLLGDRYADAPGFVVHCGAPEKFTASEPFDVIVALDGMRRLPSSDGADLDWESGFAHLSAMLAPAGRFLLTVENELGIHRLSGAISPDRDDWRPVADRTRPSSLSRLQLRLGTAGLIPGRMYAVYPHLDAAAVLLATDLLADPGIETDVPAVLVAAECARTYAESTVLTAPQRLAESAIKDGLGNEMAAAWVVVAHRDGADEPLLPDGLLSDGGAQGKWNIGYELSVDPVGGWTRRLGAAQRAMQPISVGRVRREPERLTAHIPPGRVLDGMLLDACAREDTLRLRATLQAFTGWLREQVAAGRATGELLFATTDNVVIQGDAQEVPGGAAFALLDPSWRFADEVSFDQLLCRILRLFAVRLLSGGHRHAWPPGTGADTLTATLCAMAGHPVERRQPLRAAWLEAEVAAARFGLSALDEQRLLHKLTDMGTHSFNPRSHREVLEANGRLLEDLHAANLKIEWLEKLLEINDRRLKSSQNLVRLRDRKIKKLRGSASYRIGRVLTAPVHLPLRAMVNARVRKG